MTHLCLYSQLGCSAFRVMHYQDFLEIRPNLNLYIFIEKFVFPSLVWSAGIVNVCCGITFLCKLTLYRVVIFFM